MDLGAGGPRLQGCSTSLVELVVGLAQLGRTLEKIGHGKSGQSMPLVGSRPFSPPTEDAEPIIEPIATAGSKSCFAVIEPATLVTNITLDRQWGLTSFCERQ